jgi:hypothetical protein
MKSLWRTWALINVQFLIISRPVPITNGRRIANLALQLRTRASWLQTPMLTIEWRTINRTKVVPKNV